MLIMNQSKNIPEVQEMTKEEAIKAMAAGKRVTHRLFSSDEWVRINSDGLYQFEDEVVCHSSEFWKYRDHQHWNAGWFLYVENNKQK